MDRLQTASMISQIPLSRMGDKTDIGHAAAFLFSPAAYWITGQVLVSHQQALHLAMLTFRRSMVENTTCGHPLYHTPSLSLTHNQS
jgi:hypothetical protein